MTETIALFLALSLKHFVCDFILQTKWQAENKGTYGHDGGILHASIHLIGTFIAIAAVVILTDMPGVVLGIPATLASFADAILHYHIDWAKMRLNKHYYLTVADIQFWWLLGLDQLLHYLTYIVIVSALI